MVLRVLAPGELAGEAAQRVGQGQPPGDVRGRRLEPVAGGDADSVDAAGLLLKHELEGSGVFCPWWAWVAVEIGGGTVGGVAVPDGGRARLEVVVAVRAIDEERILGEVVRPAPAARAVVVSA